MTYRRLRWLIVLGLGLGACSSGNAAHAPASSASKPTRATEAAAAQAEAEDACDGTTYDIESCLGRVVTAVSRQERRLFARVVATAHQPTLSEPFSGTIPDLRSQWQISEDAFQRYRAATCDAVLTAHIEGTWRGIERQSCMLALPVIASICSTKRWTARESRARNALGRQRKRPPR